MTKTHVPAALAALVLLLLYSTEAQAQLGRPTAEESGWAPVAVGVRVGYDNTQRQEMVGAQLRIPILPQGTVELIPSADVTFLSGLKEYQYNLEAVYVLDGRSGAFYGGGGVVWRNSIFGDPADGRETAQGYTILAGLRFVGLGFLIPQIEYRWNFVDELPFTLHQVTLGVDIALW